MAFKYCPSPRAALGALSWRFPARTLSAQRHVVSSRHRVIYRWDRSPRKGSVPSEHEISAIRTGARYTTARARNCGCAFRCVIFIAVRQRALALMPCLPDMSWISVLEGSAHYLAAWRRRPCRRRNIAETSGDILRDFLRGRTIIFALVSCPRLYETWGVVLRHDRGGVAWMAAMSLAYRCGADCSSGMARARSLAFYTLSFQGSRPFQCDVGAIAEREGDSIALCCASIDWFLGVVAAGRLAFD